MRNNNRHATRFLLRRYWYMAVVVFVAAFLALPYSALGYLPMRRPSSGDADVWPAETLQNLTLAVSQDGFFSGHLPEYCLVRARGQGLHNQILPVRITGLDGTTLLGEVTV